MKTIRKRMVGDRRRGSMNSLVRSRAVVRQASPRRNIIRAVTIKGIDKTNGETVWEYGPGSFWRHHYGLDAITGVVPDLTAELDKYAIAAEPYPAFAVCGDRSAGTLEANCCEGLSLVKLNSLDGTTIESATLTGLFTGAGSESSIGLLLGQSITNAAALSGGDFVIVGERVPFIEFLDFTSNTSSKSYILHAHGLQDGNVYLKTRTSSETITIPYDSTASEVETLFEATSDCTAATVTGGPWPLLPITVEATWSASSGDISGIATTGTYEAEGALVEWDFTITEGGSIDTMAFTVNRITVGAKFRFTFNTGDFFEYTSLTDNNDSFIAACGAALGTYVATHTGLVPADDPGEVTWVGNVLSVNYLTVTLAGPLTPSYRGGGETFATTRRAGMCAATYDTATGEMTSAVGYVFGYSQDRPPLKMFSDDTELPGTTGLSILGIQSIGSGPENSLTITPLPRGSGDGTRASVVECWTIDSGAWAFNWQIYCNAPLAMPQIIQCESGYIMCEIIPTRIGDPFTGTDRTAARIAIAGASIDEITRRFASLSSGGSVVSRLYDDSPGSNFSGGYSLQYQDLNRVNNKFQATVTTGDDTDLNGTFLRLGALAFAADGTSVFGTSFGATTSFHYDQNLTYSTTFTITYFPQPFTRSDEPQQYRFRFANGATTSWLDWYATAVEIRTALLSLMGENSDPPGFGSNVQILESPDLPMENYPYPTIEARLTILFRIGSSGTGYADPAYFSPTVGQLIIEVQDVTVLSNPPGISAYDITDASLIWSRPFGTALIGGATVTQPTFAWLQGDYVYAYGQLLESEL